MPCDNRRCNYLNPEYEVVIESIESLLDINPEAQYIIGADWNTDMDRRNSQTKCFKHVIERNSLVL